MLAAKAPSRFIPFAVSLAALIDAIDAAGVKASSNARRRCVKRSSIVETRQGDERNHDDRGGLRPAT